MGSPLFIYLSAFSIMMWYKILPDSLYFLLWSKFYSILLLLGLQFFIEYVSYGVLRYLHVFVVSAVLDYFLHTYQIQCVSGLLINLARLACKILRRNCFAMSRNETLPGSEDMRLETFV